MSGNGSGTGFFLIWFVLAALLGGCAAITFLDGWARLPMWMLWILRGILLVFVVSFVIIEGCIISQMHAKADENLDYIIVLGAQVRADGPSKVLKHRLNTAIDYLETVEPPYVVKADGLAYGKGVLVTEDLIAAQGWARLCISGEFGDAGSTVVIEEYLAGREVSVFAICDGTRAVALEPARDYKRHLDGGRGPNTGGMGCYSPVNDLPEDLVDRTINEVIDPVLATLAEDGIEYRGFLYAGLVLTDDGPKVLEFNCRLGDPETQVLLSRLNEDLLELLASAAEGYLPDGPLQWHDRAAVDVVLTAAGYPDNPETGRAISGVAEVNGIPNVQVFHANTRRTPEGLITAGGRVLNVVATGQTVADARALAYEAASHIHFGGIHFRRDVAQS